MSILQNISWISAMFHVMLYYNFFVRHLEKDTMPWNFGEEFERKMKYGRKWKGEKKVG